MCVPESLLGFADYELDLLLQPFDVASFCCSPQGFDALVDPISLPLQSVDFGWVDVPHQMAQLICILRFHHTLQLSSECVQKLNLSRIVLEGSRESLVKGRADAVADPSRLFIQDLP